MLASATVERDAKYQNPARRQILTERGLLTVGELRSCGNKLYSFGRWTSISRSGHGVKMTCPERERLAYEYRSCVERFRDAVLALKDLRGEEFDRAYQSSEKHRIALDKARSVLEQHRNEHHC